VLAVLLLGARPASAQTYPGTEARFRLGPVDMTPTIALGNAGVDTNVFNRPASGAPQSDFTMTVTPATDLWLRLGRTWLAGNISEDLVWYRTFASERTVNGSYKVAWDVPFNRLHINLGTRYLNTRERPGFEIDARSQRHETSYDATATLKVTPIVEVGLRSSVTREDYDLAAIFLGTRLHDELNRTTTVSGLTFQHHLTPLTDINLEISRQLDRFEFSPLRDTDSTAVTGGFNFSPFAVLTGHATLGYRDLEPRSSELPGYRGPTASMDLSYVVFGMTKLALTLSRDVQYSFDIDQPYYLQTEVLVSVTQHLAGPWDATMRRGAATLAYRDRQGAVVAVSNRVDETHTFGAGFGYRISRDLRVGFNLDKTSRTSPIDNRLYNGLIYGTSVTRVF
jgi:hypothetical protein